MSWSIRVAGREDVPALENLIRLSVRTLQAGHYSGAQMEAALESIFGVDLQIVADGTYFVAELDGQTIGGGGWSRRRPTFDSNTARAGKDETIETDRELARIRAFFVHPDFARRGIGRALLSACEAAVLKSGFSAVELVATLTGEPLYASFSYEVAERYELSMAGGLHLPVVRMRKRFIA